MRNKKDDIQSVLEFQAHLADNPTGCFITMVEAPNANGFMTEFYGTAGELGQMTVTILERLIALEEGAVKVRLEKAHYILCHEGLS